jgi:hypothetical protein
MNQEKFYIETIEKWKLDVMKLQSELSAARASNKSMRQALLKLTVGTCSCLIKSPDIQYHKDHCNYKIATAALSEPAALHKEEGEKDL